MFNVTGIDNNSFPLLIFLHVLIFVNSFTHMLLQEVVKAAIQAAACDEQRNECVVEVKCAAKVAQVKLLHIVVTFVIFQCILSRDDDSKHLKELLDVYAF